VPIFPNAQPTPAQMGQGVITDPREWAGAPGWSFWLVAGSTALITSPASATAPSALAGHGWTATAVAYVEDSGADLLSSGDDAGSHFRLADANDVLCSPQVFGTYSHALAAARFLGAMPTKLVLEVRGRWNGVATNQTTSFFGMTDSATTDAAAARSAGCVVTNATTFNLVSDNNSDAGVVAYDAVIHTWLIRYDTVSGTTEWFMDGVSQGSFANEADIYPLAFKIMMQANDFYMIWANVRYEL